jgi:hypothetical protein
MFLGIGYFFIGVLDMFHTFLYPGVSIIFNYGNQSYTVQFWIATRYMEALTLLGSTLLLFKNVKKLKISLVFLAYLLITVILSSILYFNIFPTCYVEGLGFTPFKIISEYIISAILILVAVTYYRYKGTMDYKLFFYMECHIITMAVSEIFFTSFLRILDWTNLWAHLLRVVSYFCLYKA